MRGTESRQKLQSKNRQDSLLLTHSDFSLGQTLPSKEAHPVDQSHQNSKQTPAGRNPKLHLGQSGWRQDLEFKDGNLTRWLSGITAG